MYRRREGQLQVGEDTLARRRVRFVLRRPLRLGVPAVVDYALALSSFLAFIRSFDHLAASADAAFQAGRQFCSQST